MKSVNCLQPSLSTSVPLFLAPAFADFSINSRLATRLFSSASCNQAPGRKRDLNRRRGESAIRSTGPRRPLRVQMKYEELPQPQADEDRPLKAFPTNPKHGLYGFFNQEKETVMAPEREEQHGRSWTYAELVLKSFEDLHALYWQGLMEINRIRTRSVEHQRLKLGYGVNELRGRLFTVKDTLSNIRRVLRDRQDAYEEAKLVKEREKSIANLDQWLEEKEREEDDRIAKEYPKIKILTEPEEYYTHSAPVSDSPSVDGSPETPVIPPRPKH